MGKVPRDVAINIRRSKDVNHEWMIGEFLDKLWQELVIRSAKHPQRKCRDKRQCDKCKKTGHHTSICSGETTPNLHVATKGAIAYQTVQAKINIPGYDSVPYRMLLETGSDKTYLVQKIADKLKGKPIRHETKVLDTIHGSRSHRCAVYNLEIRNMEGEVQLITEAATLSKLTTVRNARPEIVQQRFKHLKDIKFSDVSEHDELEIHVIIGLEDLGRVKTGRYIRGEEDQPIAEETKLGWTLLGPTYQGTKTDDQESKLLFCMENRPEIATEVDRLWDLETVGIREGDPVHVEFKDTVKFNGRRYVVNLPWKSATAKASLPDNKKLCEKRLRSQLKRLSRVPEQLEAYDGIIQEQIKAGIVEKAPKKETGVTATHYIPDHAVIRQEAESTKVRIVFDASAKERKGSYSLNECLHKGPPLMPMLFDIVLRYRMYPVALVGDVQKAFHQIEVAVEDRDCLRFLWVEDPKNAISELSELRFTRVIFGAGPSPFLLNATMQRHIGGYEETDPEFVRLVVKSLFVDDFVGGGRNSTEVITLKKKLTDVMQEGGFTLHKWKSNIEEVCSSPTVDSEGDEDETFAKQKLNLDESQSKVLGIKWNPRSDIMAVELSQVAEEAERDLRMTKRELLSRLSRIYDPLGVAGPITIVGRKIFQDACKEGITWDSLVSEDLHGRGKTFERNLKQRSEIEFPRCVALSEKPKEMSLHTFADASQTAYCAAVYLVVTLPQGKFSNLLTAKTRLPPLKKEMTIPRLELTAARIAARLAATVKQALAGFELKRVCMLSDSCTALHWLQRRGQYRQFVEHRVKEIEHLSNGATWQYCPTSENPADLGTRGKTPLQLQGSDLWWQGPSWLISDQWPEQPILSREKEIEDEEKNPVLQMATTIKERGLSSLIRLKDYSSKRRLLGVTAWILRFMKNCRASKGDRLQLKYVTTDEVKEAEKKVGESSTIRN
ncbi:uncharacterized protein LOC135681921 [Rhopilema esculentum]|uniref:uncharacterized protein LOC135681921 n=1 Tax=Rhopilema esculentum TaxID=499914 RepID=UPI0031DA931B